MSKYTSTLLLLVFSLMHCALLHASEQLPADAKRPTQQALQTLLSGNSNEGLWAGRSYLQYFSPHGSTDFQEVGRAISRGSWRVNDEGQYCSVWPPSPKWVCYTVFISGDDIYWQSGKTYYKARVIAGNVFKP